MGKTTKTIYSCDLCDFETEDKLLIKDCRYCERDFCKDCGIDYYLSFSEDSQIIYSDRITVCKKCVAYKDKIKDLMFDNASRTIGQINVKFSD